MIKYILLLTCFVFQLNGFCQTAESKMVPIWVNYTKTNPEKIILNWNYVATATTTAVWRKQIEENTWKVLISALTFNDTVYTDTSFKVGVFYEYMLVRTVGGSVIYGTIAAGTNIAPPKKNMECLVVVDSNLYSRLQKPIDNFIETTELDGWRVKLVMSSANQSPVQVKAKITDWNTTIPFNAEKSIVLIGKVPIPYSGNIAPDAHIEHVGAWPADCYYAELNGSTWNDFSVTTPGTTTRPENRNIPGDGKFDESAIPDLLDAQLGRIYLDSLSVMGVSADSLYIRYFEKIAKYKTKNKYIPRTACIEDRLNALGSEWPGRNVFQNAYSLVGKDSTVWAPNAFLSTIKSKQFLFAQVTSTGGYTQVINVATNAQVKDSMNAVFQGYFGSYFGDWDNRNNFLRSAIAGVGLNLTAVWAGRPQWIFHHMTLGKSIGYATKTTQNNVNTYYAGASANNVHIALMGDPTLKFHIVAPMKNLTTLLVNNKTEVKLNWDPVEDDVSRYYIFKSDSLRGFYSIYDSVMIGQNTYTDIKPKIGTNYYMVRAAKLESTHVGTYYNLGLGKKSSIDSVITKPSFVKNYFNQTDIHAYTNNTILHIKTNSIKGPLDMVLINTIGMRIKEIKWNQEALVNLENMANGIYLLNFYYQQELIHSQKIFINK